jgi:hypothetical protein
MFQFGFCVLGLKYFYGWAILGSGSRTKLPRRALRRKNSLSIKELNRTWTLTVARLAVMLILANAGCSTVRQEPIGAMPELPPEYIHVPHPEGLDRADLVAIFTDLKAPSPEQLKDCDSDWQKLKQATISPKERSQGARELIRQDPVSYHWCFYGKLVQLDEKMKNSVYIDEKQKEVLKTYSFLAPLARAFMEEYNDTRYMRWAVNRYRQLSHYVFYREVDMTPRMTEELASATNPFGAYRPSKDEPMSVLSKYGIGKKLQEAPASDVKAKDEKAETVTTATVDLTDAVKKEDQFPAQEQEKGIAKEMDVNDPALPAPVASQANSNLDQVAPAPVSQLGRDALDPQIADLHPVAPESLETQAASNSGSSVSGDVQRDVASQKK